MQNEIYNSRFKVIGIKITSRPLLTLSSGLTNQILVNSHKQASNNCPSSTFTALNIYTILPPKHIKRAVTSAVFMPPNK